MGSKPENPQAFPLYHPTDHTTEGMTLRDYFASQALAGLHANQYFWKGDVKWAAKLAYAQADAMLAARQP